MHMNVGNFLVDILSKQFGENKGLLEISLKSFWENFSHTAKNESLNLNS